jgi:hypothetical protein
MKFVVEIGKGIAAMSPTGRGRRNRRHRRVFRSFLAELQTEKDSMADDTVWCELLSRVSTG